MNCIDDENTKNTHILFPPLFSFKINNEGDQSQKLQIISLYFLPTTGIILS